MCSCACSERISRLARMPPRRFDNFFGEKQKKKKKVKIVRIFFSLRDDRTGAVLNSFIERPPVGTDVMISIAHDDGLIYSCVCFLVD